MLPTLPVSVKSPAFRPPLSVTLVKAFISGQLYLMSGESARNTVEKARYDLEHEVFGTNKVTECVTSGNKCHQTAPATVIMQDHCLGNSPMQFCKGLPVESEPWWWNKIVLS